MKLRSEAISPSWLIASNILPLKFISLLSGCFTSTRGFPILRRTVFVYNVLCVGLSALGALLLRTVSPSLTTSCCMFWAACTLGYFGFLRAAEFTVPNLASFSPLLHLTVTNIAVDAPSSPACMRIKIKASREPTFTLAWATLLSVLCMP